MSDLPSNYTKISLAQLAPASKERGDPTKTPESPYIGLEHIEKDTAKLVSKGTAAEVKSTKSKFKQGDLLYGKLRPYLNKVWLADFDGLCSTDILVFPQSEGFDNRFLKYRFLARDFVSYANANSSGVNLPRVNLKALGKFDINLPPLPEQRRIVAKIEELFSKLDAGVAALQQAKAQLKRYRQSVLAAAVTGELTQAWREEQGVTMNDWSQTTLGDESSLVTSGSRGWAKYYSDNGPLFIRAQNIKTDALVLDDLAHVQPPASSEGKRTQVFKNDLLITITGANVTKSALVKNQLGEAYVSQHVALVRPSSSANSPFLYYAIISPRHGRAFLEEKAYGAGKPGLNLTHVKDVPICLPPVTEQHQIVAEVEARTTAIDHVEVELDAQIIRSICLRQSILNMAFSGTLVAQDPKDEPAANVLKRVPSTKSQTTSGTRPNATTSTNSNREIKSEKQKMARSVPPPEGISWNQPATMRHIRLIQLKLHDDYSSLKAGIFDLRSLSGKPERLAPLCLVGMNGSGKSNLIEALSEILCHVELSLLNWEEITKKQRVVRLGFSLDYQVFEKNSTVSFVVRLKNMAGGKPQFTIIRDDQERIEEDPKECLDLLPSRIIGYSSGLNETISIPYFRTASVYSDEVLKQAGREDSQKITLSEVQDSRVLFMDYECNALIFVANYLLQPKSALQLFRRSLRINGLESFEIRFRPTYQGKKPVKLTNELKGYVELFRKSASSCETQADGVTEVFRFVDLNSAAKTLKKSLGRAELLFEAFYKLSLLNALALSSKERDFYLKSDLGAGQLERPPTVPRSERVFSLENIKVNLTKPKCTIDYAGLSDGEHQFLQIFGGVLLFNQPGCIFLFDEPETHFNPQWRRRSIEWLANIKSSAKQELMISTHSPFVVSGCKGKNVFEFLRKGGKCMCLPVDIETFGASSDFLLSRLFGMETMVAAEAIRLMEDLVNDGSIEELRAAIPQFGESIEKRFIFERIAELEKKKR